MKFLRLLSIVAVAVVLVVALACGLALTSSVQTWAVRKMLPHERDVNARVDRVDAGFHRTQFEGVTIEEPGFILQVPLAVIDASLVSAAQKNILVRRLVAKGWILDFTAASRPAAAAAAERVGEQPSSAFFAALGAPAVGPGSGTTSATGSRVPFDGVFKMLRLSFDLQVDEAELDGEVIFPGPPGQPPVRMKVHLDGGKLATGEEGKFPFAAETEPVHEGQAVNHALARGVLTVRMDTPRSFDRLTLTWDAEASGARFPQGAKVHGEASAAREAQAESYHLAMRTPGANKDLLSIAASFPSEAPAMNGHWQLDAEDDALAPFALGRPLPGFMAVGEGEFSVDRTGEEMHATGALKLDLSRLGELGAAWAAFDRLHLDSAFDLTQRGERTQVTRAEGVLKQERPVATLQTLQPCEFNLRSGELKVADPGAALLRLQVHGLPLAWLQPYVSQVSFAGDDLTGDFVASARDGGFALRATEPATVSRLAISRQGQVWMHGITAAAEVETDYTPEGWQVIVSNFLLRDKDRNLFQGQARAGRQTSGDDRAIKATGRVTVELPAVLAQPIVGADAALSRGEVEVEFTTNISATATQLGAKLNAHDLATAQGEALPKIETDLRADFSANGRVEAHVPLRVEQENRHSDLDLSLVALPQGAHWDVQAQATSQQIFAPDLALFVAPLQRWSAPTPGAEKRVADEPARDQAPPWEGVSGELKLALKKVIYSPELQASDVSGSIKIGAQAIAVENLRALLGGGGEAKFAANLAFDQPTTATSYNLGANLNVSGFDPAPFLRAFDTSKPAVVEGRFDLVGKFDATARTMDEIADRIGSDLKLTSRGGKFHGFAASAAAANIAHAQEKVSTLSSIVGMAAAVVGRSSAASAVEKARAAADALRHFGEIAFDQLNLELTQRPGEAAAIKDFSLISPEVRLNGTGTIDTSDVERPWTLRPLTLDVQMAVRGGEADDLRVLGLLKNEPDSLGYLPLFERFRIEGTADELGTKALTQLVQAKLQPTP